jgi:hypothetical protein
MRQYTTTRQQLQHHLLIDQNVPARIVATHVLSSTSNNYLGINRAQRRATHNGAAALLIGQLYLMNSCGSTFTAAATATRTRGAIKQAHSYVYGVMDTIIIR